MKRRRAGYQASPEALLRIAESRTSDIRHVFMHEAGWKPLDIAVLCESCYMQGINDAADALAQTQSTEPLTDQGVIWWP